MATARIVKQNKKKKMKLRPLGKLVILAVVVFIGYFASQTMLRAHNVALQTTKENLIMEKNTTAEQVSSLESEVQNLSNPTRIQEVAKDAGLENKPENVVNLPNE